MVKAATAPSFTKVLFMLKILIYMNTLTASDLR